MLSILTINIQAAALPRARALASWLDSRPEDLFILTETSAGPGTAYLLDACRGTGMQVLHTPDPGDRGVALASRVPLAVRRELFAGVSLPSRIVAAEVLCDDPAGPVTVAGIYVPSSDRAPDKLARKQRFLSSLLRDLDAVDPRIRAGLIVGGDYNVITRDHEPAYRNFLPFEYAMLDAFAAHGLTDAHTAHRPGVQAHSWIGRGGNGYRFDYFHAGSALAAQITGSEYLHQPREDGLSDHAAVILTLDVAARRLALDPAGIAGADSTLF